MYKTISAALVFWLGITLLFPSSALSERGVKLKQKRLALVIGNSNYKTSPLKNPANDSLDMAHALSKLDFTVIHKQNVSQKTMERSIRDFGRKLRNGGVGLFYFAGHGMQVQGHNYLIPIDADIESASDVKFEAIDVGRVLGKMEDAGNGLNIIILDACRDNPFARSFRSSRRGLAHMDAPKGTFVAYATAPGAVAADGEGRNGLYTKYLLKQMKVPGLTIEKLFKNVRIHVINDTSDRQVPWESSSLTGNFYFNAPEANHEVKATAYPAIPGKNPDLNHSGRSNYEIVFWESIKNSSDGVMYREYLKKFPDGLFASLAKRKIEKFDTVEKPAVLLNGIQKKQQINTAKFSLRKKGSSLINEQQMLNTLKSYGFYDGERNSHSSFMSTLIDEENGTLRDTGTGLIWQKEGSPKSVSLHSSKRYIKKLNREKYAGYSDWRLPTIEELASLLQKNTNSKGLHINDLFDEKQKRCWSNDGADCMNDFPSEVAAWVVDYKRGKIRKANWFKKNVGSWRLTYECIPGNFIRAVRP